LFFLRFAGGFLALFLLGLAVAFLATRDRKYLRLAYRTLQVALLFVVALGLLYVFERVFLML
jgi:hypothetical protein